MSSRMDLIKERIKACMDRGEFQKDFEEWLLRFQLEDYALDYLVRHMGEEDVMYKLARRNIAFRITYIIYRNRRTPTVGWLSLPEKELNVAREKVDPQYHRACLLAGM